ncbi:probable DNA mismatch repair protein Msh6 isoform X1 [Maniola hyperantus]|uniref:probable DNA mismatch repair protein Msh6 isoform X1 n=1 Tax=Aphantopus hyperantus TaxID=2795564 RepID=UPI0015685F36|nr:probable DNA mismatch repair protein Msh6 isoform X1 [Maniola hyperantus]
MSKRIAASNTLFNYFTKTPPSNKKAKLNGEPDSSTKLNSPVCSEEKIVENKKRERLPTKSPEVNKNISDSEDEAPISVKKRKRIRLNPLESDDSDVENKTDNKIGSSKETVSLEKKLQESFKYEPGDSPKCSKTKRVVPNDVPQIKTEPQDTPAGRSASADEGNWIHCKLDWLKPDKIRDAHKRKSDHPDYDPSTLYVPPDFMKIQTPAHKQWWEMKSAHYDCVLFFKVGKFYELYHMDAAVGVNELGFSYMKGEFAHSGFPESAYARMVSTLVSKGYKVARVEQTETPDMMQERCKKNGLTSKYDKVVRREICQVSLRGAQALGLQDSGPAQAASEHMLAIAEEENNGRSTYGVCFIDTTIGQFHIGQFSDDKHSSRLLTTLAHYPPALIIFDRKHTTSRTSKLVSTHCHNARRESTNMWAPEKTLKTLAEKYYKTDADGDWPKGIRPFLHEGDALGLTPAQNCYLAIKALGGCVSYLTHCLLDIQILGMAQFEEYSPPDVLNTTLTPEDKVENQWRGGNTMVLDAITLRNLRIVQDEGCLYDKLNFCSTPMGKRLLYQWVCSPSCNLSVIKERQEAIKALFENQELCQDAKNILTTLPDLDRLLAKIHALGNFNKSKHHPDSRAIFYEEKTYSKRKVLDFISVLNGFTAALKMAELFSDTESDMLKRITQFSPDGRFPDYRDTLKFFKGAFNQKEAEKEGRILPGEGVDQEYDSTLQAIKEIEGDLKEYLAEQERHFKCRLHYVGTDKKRYQIEVPQNAASRAGSEYHLEGARKGFKKFSTSETKEFLARMSAAEEQKTNVLKDLSRRIFEKFSSSYNQWECAIKCIATLDILLSFTEFARQQSGDVCLPDVTFEKAEKPYINIVEGRHPCIPIVNDFIPNDTQLGVDNARLLLLTGPNMGGKSTLMRQVGLLTVLAHLGSYVPAQECRLSLVDRIFTRLGASDDILSGQSTFLVEMNETAAIVKHATLHSLVLLDELGRGTSTYDGTAIASGVCVELAERSCRCVFSTHYHSLVHHLASHPNVQLGHMACMVETDETTPDNEDNIPEETITFLYKLSPGACPKSYGFNAARLAGIPRDITARAHCVSRNLEKEAACVRAFRDLFRISNASELRKILSGLSI